MDRCGWLGGSVFQWVASGHITKYQIDLDLIEIIQFCLKNYDLLRHPQPMGGCMGQWVVSGKITSLIKPELIDIIRFCLKIYDLWRHPTYGWMGGLMGGLM